MFKKSFFVFLFLIGNLHPGFAQKTVKQDESCYLCKNGEHKSESPYKYGFKKELPFLITSAGFISAGLIIKYTDNTNPFTIDQLSLLNRNTVNSFDRRATYNWNVSAQNASDIMMVGIAFLPALFLTNHHTRCDIWPILVMGLEVASITYGATASTKFAVDRTRPYVYNTDLSVEQRTDKISRSSFFSGHTSFTAAFSFFFAKVISDYHPNMRTGIKIGVWVFAAGFPAGVASLRVIGGKHFRTDVIAGYAIGALTGWLIPQLHKKKQEGYSLSVYPSYQDGVSGIGLTLKF